MTAPLNRGFLERISSSGDGRCVLPEGEAVRIYPASVRSWKGSLLFLFRGPVGRRLGCLSPARSQRPPSMNGRSIADLNDGSVLFSGPLDHENSVFLRSELPFLAPLKIPRGQSFGLGDRLGLAGPAHLRAVQGTGLFPVLAQQSIRELERTARTPDEVMDCAVLAAFQEGYTGGFGADGDHLKTTSDLDRVVNAGYLFFTFDPGSRVENAADHLEAATLTEHFVHLPWSRLERSPDELLKEYVDRPIRLAGGLTLRATETETKRATVKYGRVLAELRTLFEHLSRRATSGTYQVEISIDETEAVTTPFEHFLLMRELRRLGVQVDSLAPRFVGRFEKGIDYRGDLGEFETEFARHVAVRDALEGYRLSLHSGSDKFSIYPIFDRLGGEWIHVKTAGTSYLEALRALIRIDLALFGEILEFSRARYSDARASYHVSADPTRLPDIPPDDPGTCDELLRTHDDLRQVLHVAFGDVLTARKADGSFRFRLPLLAALDANEETHYHCLEEHFTRHFEAFRK